MEHLKKGEEKLEAGDYQGALSDFTKAIQLDPNNAEAYYYRGSTYNRLHKYREAIADLTNAIQIDLKNLDAYGERAFAYNELGQYDDAIADIAKAEQIYPDYADPYTIFANRLATVIFTSAKLHK